MDKNEDIGLLVIKPEAVKKRLRIIKSLSDMGYILLLEKELNNWLDVLDSVHPDIPASARKIYKSAYKKYKFGNKYIVLILRHRDGDTINKLIRDKGHYVEYINDSAHSLRGQFGESKKYHLVNGGTKLTFPGIHTSKDREELSRELKIFDIDRQF